MNYQVVANGVVEIDIRAVQLKSANGYCILLYCALRALLKPVWFLELMFVCNQ